MVKYVITLANSVVGVSVLALPFCFQQCGIVLATVMLICSAIMTRIVCHFLLKGGTITRRRTYELLAYHTYGHTGKLLAELTIIGFLLGTLIAFLVVMGDLGPQIVSEVFDIENNDSLRTIIMTGLALFVALPLGLLKNIDSLGSVSIITLMFYMVLVCKILGHGVGPLWAGTCLNDLNYWRPAGILQCIPIFAMALSCQTQIFPIYDSLHEPTLSKMNSIVKNAVYICTCFYFCVGFFGYVAFCSEPVDGNILVNFKPTGSTQFIKCCFVFSIAFSVPLVVLPCRASLHSMIWRDSLTYHHLHEASSNYIPEARLRLLTVLIIGTTLVIGLMIPNIELVLGLVGSTAGSVICIIFPALMFISVTPKNTTEKLVARAILVVGVVILVMTTYATLYAVEKANVEDSNKLMKEQIQQLNEMSPKSGPGGLGGASPGGMEQFPPAAPRVKEEAPIRRKEEPPPPPENAPVAVHVQEPVVNVEQEKEKAPEIQQEQADKKLVEEPHLKEKEPEPDPVPENEMEPVPLEPAKEQSPQKTVIVEAQEKEPDSKKMEPAIERIPDVEEIRVQKPAVVPLPLDPIIAQPPGGAVLSPEGEAPAEELFNSKPKPPQEVPLPQEHPEVPAVAFKPESGAVHAGLAPAAAQPPVSAGDSALNQAQVSSSSKKPVAPVADGAVAEQLLKKIEKQQEEQRKLIEEQKQVLAELKKHHEEHDQADADASAGADDGGGGGPVPAAVPAVPVAGMSQVADGNVPAPGVPEKKPNSKEVREKAPPPPPPAVAAPVKVQVQPPIQPQPRANEAAKVNDANANANHQEELPQAAQAHANDNVPPAQAPIPISLNKSQPQAQPAILPQKTDTKPVAPAAAAPKEPQKVNVVDL